MKSFVACLFLSASAASGFAQDQLPAATSPITELVCGFQAKHFYLKADSVRQGLAVDLLVGDLQIHFPVTFRFLVNQKPRATPVDDLQVEHERLMHVFGVRDDLNEFFHVHPTKVDSGLWAVNHAFTYSGNYRIWSDVKYRGTSYSFAHRPLTVPGTLTGPGKLERIDRPRQGAYEIVFRHPEPLLSSGTNSLEFMIRDTAGSPVQTDNFLGAAMHLVIVKEDLSVFLHAHPENHSVYATNVLFRQTFPQTGNYKLFVQYRPGPAGLPPDEALLAEFYVKVGNAPAAELKNSDRYAGR